MNAPEKASFDPSHYEALAAAEEGHFWFRSRAGVIADLASRCERVHGRPQRVLEIGCGNGSVLAVLQRVFADSDLFGVDLHPEGLSMARVLTRSHLVQADVTHLPFVALFDGIGAFDVIEHVTDDRGLLLQLHRLINPGGWLLVTVPAKRWLWSLFDEEIGHRRRYEKADLVAVLEATGFSVAYVSYFMAAIVPLMWASRTLAGLRWSSARPNARSVTESQLRLLPGANGLLGAALALEGKFIGRGHSLPIGSSLAAIACAKV